MMFLQPWIDTFFKNQDALLSGLLSTETGLELAAFLRYLYYSREQLNRTSPNFRPDFIRSPLNPVGMRHVLEKAWDPQQSEAELHRVNRKSPAVYVLCFYSNTEYAASLRLMSLDGKDDKIFALRHDEVEGGENAAVVLERELLTVLPREHGYRLYKPEVAPEIARERLVRRLLNHGAMQQPESSVLVPARVEDLKTLLTQHPWWA